MASELLRLCPPYFQIARKDPCPGAFRCAVAQLCYVSASAPHQRAHLGADPLTFRDEALCPAYASRRFAHVEGQHMKVASQAFDLIGRGWTLRHERSNLGV